MENAITHEDKSLQEALQLVLDYKSDQLQDYRDDYAEDEADEQLRDMIIKTAITVHELEWDAIDYGE